MELLQKVDVKAPVSLEKPQGNTSVSNDADTNNLIDNKSFDKQLNDQINQAKDNSNKSNIDKYQQDKELSGDDGIVSTVPEVTVKQAGNIVIDEVVNASISESNGISVISEPLPLLGDTLLPDTGSELPLTPVPSQAHSFLNVQSTPLAVAVNAAVLSNNATQNSLENIETARQQQSGIIQKANALLTDNNIKQELVAPKTVNTPVNLNVNVSEKVIVQDARYEKIMSETPSANVIAQATRLQQVPLTTAVTEVLTTVNNSLASVAAVESTGVINNTNQLSNAGPLNSVFNSAISSPLQNPNWSQQMTQQVSYMIKGGFQKAEIKLNPAHLGPMEIKLSINDDQASVSFVAQHASVRDVIDSAMPRLKEMLEQQGFNLSDANVSTQSEQQQAGANSQGEESAELTESFVESQNELTSSENETIINISSGVSLFA